MTLSYDIAIDDVAIYDVMSYDASVSWHYNLTTMVHVAILVCFSRLQTGIYQSIKVYLVIG